MKTAKELGNEPANPTIEIERFLEDCAFISRTIEGLTKREYFAGLAMQGYCSNIGTAKITSKEIAILAAKQADALLEELSK